MFTTVIPPPIGKASSWPPNFKGLGIWGLVPGPFLAFTALTMPSVVSAIRDLPNYELYQLKLVREKKPAIIVAVLTQKAIDLGIRFDNDRKDYRFNLSEFLGNDNGQWTRGINFDETADNIRLDLADRKNRCLVADLRDMRPIKNFNRGMKYNLDDNLGLVDYFHPEERETYFRLGVRIQKPSRRTLVLCFDGTSNHFSNRNTNVVKLFELLKKDDPEQQMVYYQTGVGTYTSPAWIGPITRSIAKVADLAVAWYLYQHIIDGYKFLMQTYRDGDRICIFGFSRGAYTARALAGMLHCVGLLPPHNVEHIPFAYQIYASQNPDSDSHPTETNTTETTAAEAGSEETLAEGPGPDEDDIVADTPVPEHIVPSNVQLAGNSSDISPPNNPLKRSVPKNLSFGALGEGGNSKAKKTDPEAYKRAFCTPIVIDFVGVWDTVGSVGAIIPRTLPHIDHNPSIRIFRHALALDEHRANFVPSLWDHSKTTAGQDVREVWFRGQHADVGGGAPSPDHESSEYKFTALSNISLRWMVQQCLENKTSIAFDRDAMEMYRKAKVLEYRPAQPDLSARRAVIKQAGLKPIERKRAMVEAAKAAWEHRRRLYEDSSGLDGIDVRHTPVDAVAKFSLWKILELFPSTRPTQTAQGPKMTHIPNFGKARMIYRRSTTEPVFIHASVVDFLTSDKGKDYVPRATWHGFSRGTLPPIESFEGNYMDWPEPGRARDAFISAMNMDWKPAPGMWSRFKRSVASIESRFGKLVKMSQRG